MKINKLSLLFSKMRLAFILKKTVIKIGFSNFIYNILVILYNEGVIRGFCFDPQDKNKLCIFLKFSLISDNFLFNGVFVFPSNRMFKKNYVTARDIQQKYGYSKFIVVSTARGLLTGRECTLFKVGGRLLFYFY